MIIIYIFIWICHKFRNSKVAYAIYVVFSILEKDNSNPLPEMQVFQLFRFKLLWSSYALHLGVMMAICVSTLNPVVQLIEKSNTPVKPLKCKWLAIVECFEYVSLFVVWVMVFIWKLQCTYDITEILNRCNAILNMCEENALKVSNEMQNIDCHGMKAYSDQM